MYNHFFKIEKDIALSPELCDDEFLVYLVLMTRRKKIDYFSYDYLSYQMTGRIHDTIFTKRIKNGFKLLEQRHMIQIIQETKNGKEINLERLFLDSTSTVADLDHTTKAKRFITIEEQEIKKILRSGLKHRVSVLRYFICVLSTFSSHDNDDGYFCRKGTGHYSIENLADLAGINKNTVFHYNKWLEENGLLYINHSYDVLLDDKGKIEKGIPNCYGRPRNKEAVNTLQFLIHQNYSQSRQMKSLSKNANQKRSVAQKINNLKKGKVYTNRTLQRIYNFCKQSNEEKQHELEKLSEMIRRNQITEFDARQRKEQINSKPDYDLDYIKNKMKEAEERQIQKEGGG